MTVEGLDEMQAHIKSFKKELSGNPASKRLLKQAKALIPTADEQAARAVGGDQGFTGGRGRGSGWRRKNGNVIPADTEARLEGELTAIVRAKPKNRGQWRVIESGRKAYAAGSEREAGSYTRKKTGERVQRVRKVKRTVGATRGWKGWSKAERRMRVKARVGHTKDTVRAFRRTFGRR